MDIEGYARSFISRNLLEAQSMKHALKIATTHHIGGHNYQLTDFKQRNIINLEV
jgi:hypothetical protein